MLEWCAKQQGGHTLMHYLDDSVTWGRANKACLIKTCDQLSAGMWRSTLVLVLKNT